MLVLRVCIKTEKNLFWIFFRRFLPLTGESINFCNIWDSKRSKKMLLVKLKKFQHVTWFWLIYLMEKCQNWANYEHYVEYNMFSSGLISADGRKSRVLHGGSWWRGTVDRRDFLASLFSWRLFQRLCRQCQHIHWNMSTRHNIYASTDHGQYSYKREPPLWPLILQPGPEGKPDPGCVMVFVVFFVFYLNSCLVSLLFQHVLIEFKAPMFEER